MEAYVIVHRPPHKSGNKMKEKKKKIPCHKVLCKQKANLSLHMPSACIEIISHPIAEKITSTVPEQISSHASVTGEVPCIFQC